MWKAYDDFVEFDDADVDWESILEEKNETETILDHNQVDLSSSSTSGTVSLPPPVKTSQIFKCPECDKEYKSASGFRGHVKRDHKLLNIKGKLLSFTFVAVIIVKSYFVNSWPHVPCLYYFKVVIVDLSTVFVCQVIRINSCCLDDPCLCLVL